MRATKRSEARRLYDYFFPRLFPGLHRKTGIPALDEPRTSSVIVDGPAFDAWAARWNTGDAK